MVKREVVVSKKDGYLAAVRSFVCFDVGILAKVKFPAVRLTLCLTGMDGWKIRGEGGGDLCNAKHRYFLTGLEIR